MSALVIGVDFVHFIHRSRVYLGLAYNAFGSGRVCGESESERVCQTTKTFAEKRMYNNGKYQHRPNRWWRFVRFYG